MKILIIRLSSMGDVVVASPVVRWIKLQLGAEIHFLIKPQFKEIIQYNPYIDQIKIFGDKEIDLRSEKYDMIIDLHKSIASTKVRWSLGIPSISYKKLNIRKWLLTHLKINTLPKIHLVDRYAEAVSALGIVDDGKGLDFFIRTDAVLPNELPEKYTVIVLGAAHATKRISYDIAEKIISKNTDHIALLGGKDVMHIGQKLANAFSNISNFCGKLDLHTSARIIKSAHHIHTGDTGLMHISAALDKNITVYWGSTAPIIGMYPYLQRDSKAVISHKILNLWCQPCSKIGYDRCPLGHFNCMKKLEID